jgi:4-amino-4-deoxy-L-arabinose transferase-like glycosyltransferase
VNDQANVETRIGLPLAVMSLLLLIAYTCSAPFRDLYGLEIRNALFAREMLDNGFSLIPTALGKPYPDYPGLYFWIETAFSRLAGHVTPLSAVLPSAVFAVGCVGVTFLLADRINRRTGWFAAAMLSTFPEFWLRASQATIDIPLAFHVTAAIACLFFSDASVPRRRLVYTIGAFIFMVLAFFTKGPIGIVLPVGAWGGYLLLEKRFKSIFRFALISGAVAALCVAIQLWVLWHTGGGDLIRDVIVRQITGRFADKSNHPPYYYLTSLLANGGIWLIVAIPAVAKWLTRLRQATWRDRAAQMLPRHRVTRIALTWFLVTFTIFTLASTRHSRYLLPLYPALAILIASGLDGMLRREKNRLWISETIISAPIAVILLAGVVAAFFFAQRIFVPMAWIVIWVLGVAWAWRMLKGHIESGARTVGLVVLLLATGLSGVNLLIIPQLSHKASGRQFTQAAEADVDLHIPAVLYRIDPDGDGIKFAFYSKRSPATLRFVDTDADLKAIAPPFLLIARDEHRPPVWASDLAGKTTTLVTRGRIRSHRFCAYLIEAGSRARRRS